MIFQQKACMEKFRKTTQFDECKSSGFIKKTAYISQMDKFL